MRPAIGPYLPHGVAGIAAVIKQEDERLILERDDLRRGTKPRHALRQAELLRVLEVAVVLEVGDGVPVLGFVDGKIGGVDVAAVDCRLAIESAIGVKAAEV